MSESDEGTHLVLNFQNHCLLCLQHEDPAVLRQNVDQNPKCLLDFQPIMSYLTGTVNPLEQGQDNGGANTQGQYYPVTKNLPPLCKLCYDILAELYLFHCELMELQRKILNQTEAARRIVKGTMRKRGGMRVEFFNRLKIAGVPKEDVQTMELFIDNFHDLIKQADQKAVLPQLIPLSSQSSSTMQPYHVEFVEPLHSNNKSASSSPPIRTSTPYQVVSSPGFVVQIAQPEEVDGVLNEQVDLTTSSSSSSHNHVLLVDDDEQNADVTYEYEGEEENEEHHEKLGEEEDEDDVVILEDEDQGKPDKLSAEVIDVLDEEDYESGRVNELEEEEYESDEEMDLEYWKSVLSSSLIMEQVDEEEDEQQRMEEENIEVIEVDDDDHPKGQRRSQSSSLEVIPQPIVLSVTRQYNCSSPSGEVSQMSSFPSMQERPPSSSTAYSRVRYECRHCDKIYKSVQRLRYHEQEHLPGGRPKPFLCGQCQKGFSSKKLLEQHKRVHTGERPFVCDICGDRFRQSSTLYRHKMAHKRQQQR